MKECPSCEASIPDSAAACPSCRYEFDEQSESTHTLMGFQAQMGEEEEGEAANESASPASEPDDTRERDSARKTLGPGLDAASSEESGDEASEDPLELDIKVGDEAPETAAPDGPDEDSEPIAQSTQLGMSAVDEDAPEGSGESGDLNSFLESIDVDDEDDTSDSQVEPNRTAESSSSHESPSSPSSPEESGHGRARERQASRPSEKNSGARYSTQLGMPSADEGEIVSGESSVSESEQDDSAARSTYDVEEDDPTEENDRDDIQDELRTTSDISTSDQHLGAAPSSEDNELWSGPDVEPDETSEDGGLEFPSVPEEMNPRSGQPAAEGGDFEAEDTPESGIIRFSAQEDGDAPQDAAQSGAHDTFQGGASGILERPEADEDSSRETSRERTRSDAPEPSSREENTSGSGVLGNNTYMHGQEDSSARDRVSSSSSTAHGTPAQPSDESRAESSSDRDESTGTQSGLGTEEGPTGFDIDEDDSRDIQLEESLENEALSSLSESSARIDPELDEKEPDSSKPPGFASADASASTGHTPAPGAEESLDSTSDLPDRESNLDEDSSPSPDSSGDGPAPSQTEPSNTPLDPPREGSAAGVDSRDEGDRNTSSPLEKGEHSRGSSSERADPVEASASPPESAAHETASRAPSPSPSEPADSASESAGDLVSETDDSTPSRDGGGARSSDDPEPLELDDPAAPPVDDTFDGQTQPLEEAQPVDEPEADAEALSPETSDAVEPHDASEASSSEHETTASSPSESVRETSPDRHSGSGVQTAVVSGILAIAIAGGIWGLSSSPSFSTITIGFGSWSLLTALLWYAGSSRSSNARDETSEP